MDRAQQKSLIKEIEDVRKSRVLVYITGDRHPFGAQIGEDVVRPMYDHLLNFEISKQKHKKLDLFLYSRGGDVSVPWRMVSMFRQFFGEFDVLIPYKAHSAATMISLGADKIVMGRKAELGPIDPTLLHDNAGNPAAPPSEISVEDVLSYISFIKEQANINDQEALAQLVSKLSDNLTPLFLGSVNRQHSHIRLVARKLLASHKNKVDEERLSGIVDALTEKMYSHGHAIGRKEAKEIGLPVEETETTEELEPLMWQLFLEYEKELKLRDDLSPEILLKDEEEKRFEDFPIAVLESTEKLHRFEVKAHFQKKRIVPNNMQLNLKPVFQLQLPKGINQENMPQQMEENMKQIIQQAMQILPVMVQQEIMRQSPVASFDGRIFGGKWAEK